MLIRWRPHVLVLFRAEVGNGIPQESAVRAALEPLDFADRLTVFGVSETESFNRALAGDFAFHAALGARLFDWLCAVRPGAVLGDSYQGYNYHHDLTRLLIDDAVRRYRAPGRACANYEIPLTYRPDEPGAPMCHGTFPDGPVLAFQLTANELAAKRELAARAGRADPFMATQIPLFASPETEPYRAVPADRDYTLPPPGAALYYDERGREVVAAGLYPRAITFREHFVPLVRALGALPSARRAA
jgi:hypothetical protein